MADEMIIDEVVSSNVTPELAAVITQLSEIEKKIKDINVLKVTISGELKAADSLSSFNTVAAKTEELLASINAVARENVSVVKAMEQANKAEVTTRLETAKAILTETKTITENARAKEIEARYTIALNKEIERTEKARQKEIDQVIKQQSAYAALSKEYKQASTDAQNLGAEYFRLEEQERKLNAQLLSDKNAGLNTDQLKAKIHLLGIEMENLGVRAKSAQEGALRLHTGLMSIDQSIGKSQRNVGNYNSAVFALSQVLREAPSFAYSFSTGLMGISNNIPILVDEINKLKAANLELTAAGGKAIPVWKTLSEAITSPVGLITLATAAVTIFAGRMAMAANETKKAADSLDQYNESLKEYAKIKEGMPSNIAAGIGIDIADEEATLEIMIDQTQSIEARTAAYEKLKNLMPGLFSGMTKEQALLGENANSINTHAQAIIKLQRNIEEVTKARDASVRILEQEKESQNALERTYSGTLNDPNPTKTKNINEHTASVKEYNIQLRDLKANLARINSPDIEQNKDKTKAATSKGLDAELALEKERYEKEILLAKSRFDDSAKTFEDEKQLHAAERYEAVKHGANQITIIEAWHGKVGENEDKYQARMKDAQNAAHAVLLKSYEADAAIAKLIEQRHLAAGKAIDDYVDKLTKSRRELTQLSTDLETLIANDKSKEQAAGKINIFGNDGAAQQSKIEQLNIAISAAEDKVRSANKTASDERNAETVFGRAADPMKVLDADKKLKEAEIAAETAHSNKLVSIADYTARKKEQAIREIYDLTMQLGKEAFQAFITIGENELQNESNKLDRLQESENRYYDHKKEAINATAGYQRDKDNQLSELAAQKEAKDNELEGRKRQLERDKAEFQKEAAIAQIIAGIAVAEGQALTYLASPVTAPFYPVIAGLIAATGAVQLAAASSIKIPEYRYGKDSTTTPVFIAGDGGESELIVPSGGKDPYWSASKSTVYAEPLGTKVLPYAKAMQYAKNHALSASPSFSAPTYTDSGIGELKDTIVSTTQDTIKAIFAARPRIPDNRVIADELRKSRNMKIGR